MECQLSRSHNISAEALKIAKAQGADAGETRLVEFFGDHNKIRMLIQPLKNIEAVKARWGLLYDAIDDHAARRYHASIPVVLAQVDGIIYDFSPGGAFTPKTDWELWDSFAGHSSGLKTLVKMLCAGRSVTTRETITLPYRHGILHGRDLGYANKVVAAKTWALLFAAAEWAEQKQTEG